MTTDQQSELAPRWTREAEYIHDDGLEVAKVFTGAAGDEERFAEILQALNERPNLLARIKRLEEAAYHLKLARDAWNFDQTVANFKILGDALDRVVALTE